MVKVVPTAAMSVGEMLLRQTGTTNYHAQLGLTDKGRAIKGFVGCND